MYEQVEKSKENKNRVFVNSVALKKNISIRGIGIVGGRQSKQPLLIQPNDRVLGQSQKTAIAQRVVHQKTTEGGWRYYSSHDTRAVFENIDEAVKHDTLLSQAVVTDSSETAEQRKKRFKDTRYPTLYSYTHVGTGTIIGDKTQGPHTVPHVLVAQELSRLGHDDLSQYFFNAILSPDLNTEQLMKEKQKFGNLKLNFERYIGDYKALYELIYNHFMLGYTDIGKLRDLIAQITELGVYTTYGWKTNKKVSDGAKAGKGESGKKGFQEQMDRKGDKNFKDKDGYYRQTQSREQLHMGTFTQGKDLDEIEIEGEVNYETIYQIQENIISGELGEGSSFIYRGQHMIITSIQRYYNSEGNVGRVDFQMKPGE